MVTLDRFCFESLCLEDLPTILLSTPNSAQFETHIIGNELLKRFDVIFDFQQDQLYLKLNGLQATAYVDR